jgi:hypothetical protein
MTELEFAGAGFAGKLKLGHSKYGRMEREMSPQRDNEDVKSLETDPERKTEMMNSMRRRLAIDNHGQRRIQRVRWLFSHLEEYLDRWIACLPYFSMADYVHNDLHIVIHIAINLIDEELASLVGCSALKERWQTFTAAFQAIDGGSRKDVAELISGLFANAHDELHSLTEDYV